MRIPEISYFLNNISLPKFCTTWRGRKIALVGLGAVSIGIIILVARKIFFYNNAQNPQSTAKVFSFTPTKLKARPGDKQALEKSKIPPGTYATPIHSSSFTFRAETTTLENFPCESIYVEDKPVAQSKLPEELNKRYPDFSLEILNLLLQIKQLGKKAIESHNFCTYSNQELFESPDIFIFQKDNKSTVVINNMQYKIKEFKGQNSPDALYQFYLILSHTERDTWQVSSYLIRWIPVTEHPADFFVEIEGNFPNTKQSWENPQNSNVIQIGTLKPLTKTFSSKEIRKMAPFLEISDENRPSLNTNELEKLIPLLKEIFVESIPNEKFNSKDPIKLQANPNVYLGDTDLSYSFTRVLIVVNKRFFEVGAHINIAFTPALFQNNQLSITIKNGFFAEWKKPEGQHPFVAQMGEAN